MRFIYIAASAFAAVVSAQVGGKENPFNVPQGGYEFNVGEPTTLKWDPTTDGTVTIKLHYGDDITPKSGIVLAENIPNSGEYAWVPSADLGQGGEYTIEIIDDDNEDNINFTPRFDIDGVTGTHTGIEETATATASESASETASESATETTDATTAETTEAPTTMTTDVSTTLSTVASTTTTEEATTTEEETGPSDTSTGVPSPDGDSGAMSLSLPGGLLTGVLALMALL